MQLRTSCNNLRTMRRYWDLLNQKICQESAIPSKNTSTCRHVCSGNSNLLIARGANQSISYSQMNLHTSRNSQGFIPPMPTGSLQATVWDYPRSMRYYSAVPPPETTELTKADKLKRAVKEYGATVIVFHVAISLASLGISYAAVSSGLDVNVVLANLGISPSILESKVTTGAGTFVIAYALHKVFAPVRISITLTATPFIVRYLRKVGFLKPPKPSKTS